MSPKKGFSRKLEYSSRNIHDDFLEQLTESTNDVMQMKKLFLVNPILKVVEDLYDRGN